MYESFSGLSRPPFAATPLVECFARVGPLASAAETLTATVRAAEGIAVLTAPPGLGKTLLCQRLAAELQSEFTTVLLTNGRFPTGRSVLRALLRELEAPYLQRDDDELRLELASALKAARRETQGVVLIIDEAHHLSTDALEELRALTNLAHGPGPLVRVVLCGQIALEETLAQPQLAEFNQRIRCQLTLEPLTRQESREYLRARIEWAGAKDTALFAADAIEIICQTADGVPRCLNRLCERSLQMGQDRGTCPVDAETVLAALEELKQLPLQWNEPIGTVAPCTAAPRDAETVAVAPPRRSAANRDDADSVAWSCIEVGADDDEVGRDERREMRDEREDRGNGRGECHSQGSLISHLSSL
ncbi:MAG: ExeA family protein, partial [Planctomycetaceae bacterium]